MVIVLHSRHHRQAMRVRPLPQFPRPPTPDAIAVPPQDTVAWAPAPDSVPALRAARPIRQPRRTFGAKPLHPFVARLPTKLKPSTQFRHRNLLTFDQVNQFFPQRHAIPFRPGHTDLLGWRWQHATEAKSVTHVAGTTVTHVYSLYNGTARPASPVILPGVVEPKNGSWTSQVPSTAAGAAALRANGLSPNG